MNIISNTILRWLSVVVTAFAGVFILTKDWDLEGGQVILIGFAFILAGAIIAGTQSKSWLAVFAMFLFGFYLVARGSGAIEQPIFRYIIGPLLLLASFVNFVQLTKPKTVKSSGSTAQTKE